MSAQPVGPVPAAGRPSLFAVAACKGCGNTVREVKALPRDGGQLVRLDGRDPDGEWWAVKVGKRWFVTRPEPGQVLAGGWRYAGHRCPAGPGVRAGLDVGWPGPCAGGCGGVVPRRYGWGAVTLCSGCVGVLAAWRALPGPFRPRIPYGKWVGGRYTAPTP